MTNHHAHSLLRFIRSVVGAGGPGDNADELLLHRFAVCHDQAAFAALVARHGPMVLGVCCRALRDAADVEDAFQATFLVLARKARSLARPNLLAHWLHGVARRTAQKAKVRTARRHARQGPLVEIATPDTTTPATWADVRPVLDEEIARLPERYRVPFILCYLEGRTNGDAARLMGCPEGTIASRLAWARQRLRCRLTRRGVTPSAGPWAAILSGKATMTPALAGCTAEAAAMLARGALANGPVGAKAGFLAAEVLKQMFWTKARIVAGLLLALCLVLGGGGALVCSAEGSAGDGTEAGDREVIVALPLAREVTEDEVYPGITAVESIEVGARIGGPLIKVHFKDGDEVKLGQLLFELDPRPFQAALEQADAKLAESKVNVLQAKANHEWAKKQFALKQIDYNKVLNMEAALLRLDRDFLTATAARLSASAKLHAARVDAPLSGRIYSRVAPGNFVRDNESVATIVVPGPASVYFEAPLRLLSVLAEAREGEAVPVMIGISEEKGLPRRGKVSLTGARVDVTKGLLQLRAVLPNDGIVSGQRARVRLKAGRPYHGLLVPQAALVNTKKVSFLLVINDQNVVERRPVEPGPTLDGLQVIKSGLEAKDWVVLGSPSAAQPGITVHPRKVSLLGEGGKESPTGKRPPSLAGAKTIFLADGGLAMTLPLVHTSAAEAMEVAKHVYREHVSPRGPLVLTRDTEANTLSVEGPTDLVLDVVKLVASLEELGRRNSKAAGPREENSLGYYPPSLALAQRARTQEATRYRLALAELARSTEAGPGDRLGVTVGPVSPALADQLNLPKNIGMLVTEVVPQSPAAKVGVEKNDVLLRIDGAQVPAEVDDFLTLIASLKSDTPLDIVVIRRGQRRNLDSVRLVNALTPAGKRPADLDKNQVQALKARIDLLEADVSALKDRLAWSERMAKKGYMTDQQVRAERARLESAELELDKARKELNDLSPRPNGPLGVQEGNQIERGEELENLTPEPKDRIEQRRNR
jgi:RND family efflux transporter MFP subunit